MNDPTQWSSADSLTPFPQETCNLSDSINLHGQSIHQIQAITAFQLNKDEYTL